jgi:hypothetical protein
MIFSVRIILKFLGYGKRYFNYRNNGLAKSY